MIEVKEWLDSEDLFPRIIDFGDASRPIDDSNIDFQGSAIQCEQDLPQFLILGSLEKGSFVYSQSEHHTSWEARWRGFDPDSFVAIGWDICNGWAITVTWFGSILAQVETKADESFLNALQKAVQFEKNVFKNPGHLPFRFIPDGLTEGVWNEVKRKHYIATESKYELPDLPFGKRVAVYIPIHVKNLRRASEIYQKAAAQMSGGSQAVAFFTELPYYQKDFLSGEKLLSPMDLWELTGALIPKCMLPSPYRHAFVRHGYVLRVCCAFCDLSKLSSLDELCIHRFALDSFCLPEEDRNASLLSPNPTIAGNTFWNGNYESIFPLSLKGRGQLSKVKEGLQQAEAASLKAQKLALALMTAKNTCRGSDTKEAGPAFVFYNLRCTYYKVLWSTSLHDALATPGMFHVLLGTLSYSDWCPLIEMLGYFDQGKKEEELVFLQISPLGFKNNPMGRINTQKALNTEDLKTLGNRFWDPWDENYTYWTYEFFFGSEIAPEAAQSWLQSFYSDPDDFLSMIASDIVAWHQFYNDYDKLLLIGAGNEDLEDIEPQIAVPWMINRCLSSAAFDDLKNLGKIWQTLEQKLRPKSTDFTLQEASEFLAAKCPRYQIMDPATWRTDESKANSRALCR